MIKMLVPEYRTMSIALWLRSITILEQYCYNLYEVA